MRGIFGSKVGPLLLAVAGLLAPMLVAPVTPATAVTYGNDVVSPSSSAPWVVPIYWGRINKKSMQICTGSLIDQQYVLTAAHCLYGLENGTFSVQVGGDRLGQGRRIYADGWWLNGRYSQRRFINDVGILHLVEPANVAPVASLASSRKVPAKMRIYGWGLDQNGRDSGNLMYANLNRQVRTAKWAYGPYFKKRLMIAAGRMIKREGGVYAGGCNGDSGGPLVARNSNTVLGITAFGKTGCDVSAPTIFTKVAYYKGDIARGMQSALRMAQVDNQAPPRPTAPPTITGTVSAGGTASCNPGSWLGSVKQFQFDWTLGDYDTATGQTVTLGSDTAGDTLTCTVTAIGSQGRTGKSYASVVVSTAGATTPGDLSPVVSWSSPAAGTTIANGDLLRATATASGTAKVTKACLTLNGNVPAANYAVSGYDPYYGTWDSGTGCWTDSSGMTNLALALDPTSWTNGTYTFAWTVTDNNNRTSTTASRAFTVANSNPSVSWSSPAAGTTIANGDLLRATATASGTAKVTKACLTLNGNVPAANYAVSGYDPYYGTWDSGTGCWTDSSGMTNLALALDPTSWTNGTYTFAWTVTDNNNRTSTTASRAFTVANSNPSVSWSSPAAGTTIANGDLLRATATASGTAKVTKACLTLNGNVPAANYAVSGYDPYYGTWDSGTGCWTDSSGMTNLALALDPTSWTNGTYTFAWTVTDNNNRTSTTASRAFTVANSNPSVSWSSPAAGTTIANGDLLRATATASGTAKVTKACLTLNGNVPAANYAVSGYDPYYGTWDSGTGCWTDSSGMTNLALALDPTSWTNGTYTFAWTVTDNNNRTSTTASRAFTVANSNPSVSWSSPAAGTTIANGDLLRATATASGTAKVTKACLTLNGNVPAANYAVSGYDPYYGTWDSGTGCWTDSSGMTNLALALDPTSWTNGTYTFAWTVTDNNNRTSTTASRAFTVANSNPSVSWSSPAAGTTIANGDLLRATATASGTAKVTKACLTLNGNVPAANYAVSGYDPYYGTWDSGTGCWTDSSGMTNLALALDPTSWTNGTYTFAWTVTDNNNRTSTTASRAFTVANSNPSVSWSSPAAGTTIANGDLLRATATASGTAKVTKACMTINGSKPAQNFARSGYSLSYSTWDSGTGCWNNSSGLTSLDLAVNVTAWASGNYTFAWTVTDNNSRTSTTASRTFVK